MAESMRFSHLSALDRSISKRVLNCLPDQGRATFGMDTYSPLCILKLIPDPPLDHLFRKASRLLAGPRRDIDQFSRNNVNKRSVCIYGAVIGGGVLEPSEWAECKVVCQEIQTHHWRREWHNH